MYTSDTSVLKCHILPTSFCTFTTYLLFRQKVTIRMNHPDDVIQSNQHLGMTSPYNETIYCSFSFLVGPGCRTLHVGSCLGYSRSRQWQLLITIVVVVIGGQCNQIGRFLKVLDNKFSSRHTIDRMAR